MGRLGDDARALGAAMDVVEAELSRAYADLGGAYEEVARLTAELEACRNPDPSFPIRVGAYDNEQGGQPDEATAVARAQVFDLITAGANQYAHAEAMHAANPALKLNLYRNGTHTRSTTLPESQYCHDAQGRRITTTGTWAGNILMNPADPGWRETFIAGTVDQLETSGYDGVFIDTLGRGALLSAVTGRAIDPRTGQAYTAAAWEKAGNELAQLVKAETGRVVIANGLGSGQRYFADPGSSVLLEGIDGGLAESFVRSDAFTTGFKTEARVLEDIAMVAEPTPVHVLVKDWRQGASDKDQQMRYAFAAFLLGTDGSDVFGYTGSAGTMTTYDRLWDTDLGAPHWAYEKVGAGLYRREFTNGVVTLNTTDHTGTIEGGG